MAPMWRSCWSVASGVVGTLAWSTPAAAASTDAVARDDLAAASLFLATAGWLAFFGIRERWGREGSATRPADDDEPIPPPDDPPALVDALRHRGEMRPATVGTIILDLASRGYLTIVEDRRGGFLGGETEWRFRREEPPQGSLRPYENAVYTRLFATGSDVWLSDLAGWVRSNRQQAKVFVDRIERYVAADLRERGYLERGRRLPSILSLSVAAVVALVGLVALFSGAVLGLVGLASGAAQVALTRRLRRRTATGADRARLWGGVSRTLARVGDLEEAPADSSEEWERCLVYAATLEVSDDFLEGLRGRDPDVLADDGFASWYEGSRADTHRLDSIGRFVAAAGATFAEVVEPVRVPSKLVNARR